MLFIKRTLPLIITFITGVVVIFAFFLTPDPSSVLKPIKDIENVFPEWIQIIMCFTMILGAISLLQINLSKIARKTDGWGYSLVLVLGFLAMAVLGFITGGWPMFERGDLEVNKQYVYIEDSKKPHLDVTVVGIATTPQTFDDKGNKLPVKKQYIVKDAQNNELTVSKDKLKTPRMARMIGYQDILFDGIFKQAQATMFSLLAFFVASASFRAFRVKSKEAALLMGSAFIVMLGNVPIGNWVTMFLAHIPFVGRFFDIAAIKEWILAYPSSAAQSAILIGAMLGYISSSLKIIFGVERSHLGGES